MQLRQRCPDGSQNVFQSPECASDQSLYFAQDAPWRDSETTTSTSTPRSRNLPADIVPAGPPPLMITSYWSKHTRRSPSGRECVQDCGRDQLLCLVAGAFRQGRGRAVTCKCRDEITGVDPPGRTMLRESEKRSDDLGSVADRSMSGSCPKAVGRFGPTAEGPVRSAYSGTSPIAFLRVERRSSSFSIRVLAARSYRSKEANRSADATLPRTALSRIDTALTRPS